MSDQFAIWVCMVVVVALCGALAFVFFRRAVAFHAAEFFQTQKLEALGQLTAGVAHDFNNLLSIIQGYSRIAAEELEQGHPAQEYVEKIQTAAQRGANLTKQMLAFSRNKMIAKSTLDLTQTVRDQEILMRPLIDASINLCVRSKTEGVYIESSPDSIMQILMNLVVNARDAMPSGGSLIVETRHCETQDLPVAIRKKSGSKSFACLCVTDTGNGMDRNVQKRIFDPFFTTKDHGKGTGLGLSMVYSMVRQMNGHIDVVSSIGQGTRISIFLPLSEKVPQKRIMGTLQDIHGINLNGYTALIAEDEPDLLHLVGDMLDRLGMNVIPASNGNLALLKQDNYEGTIDLLITDIVMPELDGVRLAEMFKALHPDSKVIFMSGYPANGNKARIALPTQARFLAKPVQYETLVRLVFEALSTKSESASVPPPYKSAEPIRKSMKAGS